MKIKLTEDAFNILKSGKHYCMNLLSKQSWKPFIAVNEKGEELTIVCTQIGGIATKAAAYRRII